MKLMYVKDEFRVLKTDREGEELLKNISTLSWCINEIFKLVKLSRNVVENINSGKDRVTTCLVDA